MIILGDPKITFKKILIPVDFSAHSHFAARKAISLAQIYGATLYFLHVGDNARSSAKLLCTFINEIGSDKRVNIKKLVAQGEPPNMILSAAKKLQADTIIMGSRGLSGLKSLVQGSVSEKVLRESICPVLVIKHKKQTAVKEYVLPQIRDVEGTFQADKILVPLDFSLASKQALRYALYMASHQNSTIYTLTVFDKKYKEVGDDHKKHTAIVVRGKTIRLWREFPELLRSVHYKESNTQLKRLLLSGDPASKIESVVQKKEIDLVIMGTNGRTGLDHFISGSVAEKVLRTVDCPVMTVRSGR